MQILPHNCGEILRRSNRRLENIALDVCERRENSRYASIENCRNEVREAEKMMKREGIRWLDSSTKSIEEISTTVMQEVRLDNRVF